MSIESENRSIAFVNPYDIKGGASLGTFRLFSYFRRYIASTSCLYVVVKASSGQPGVFGLPKVIQIIFYLQAAFNKSICRLFSANQLPVAFTFFVPFSLPALALFFKSRSSVGLYLHSMSSGFACPISFYLLLRKASIVKTADDWYLTGGCHYSLACDQWRNGCRSCPHMNQLGKRIVRVNWLLKRKLLGGHSSMTFVSPSNWLSARYKELYPKRSTVIYNSSFQDLGKDSNACLSGNTRTTSVVNNTSIATKSLVVLGLPVTYLRDKRKGFDDAYPTILELLANFPVKLVLCGGDANRYCDSIHSGLAGIHPDAKVESLGAMHSGAMADFYSSLDFTLHFAKYDNSPNIVTESLCCGIPVIVLDHAGSPEHIRSSGAGFVLDEIKSLLPIISAITHGDVDIPLLKARASEYSKSVLSPESMAKAYSCLLR